MSDIESDIKKLKTLIEYWLSHNREHIEENQKWALKAKSAGLEEVRERLESVIELSLEINNQLEMAINSINKEKCKKEIGKIEHTLVPHRHIELHPIGIINSPFIEKVPHQIDMDKIECSIVIDPIFQDGLYKLESFTHIYVIFHFHGINKEPKMIVTPPWAGGRSVGVFASRSPLRPNSIGLSIVKLKRIVGNKIYTTGFDVLDGSPLLDIKPYTGSRDAKTEAGDGWLSELDH